MIAPARAKFVERRNHWNARRPIGTYVRYWDTSNPSAWIIAPTTSLAFISGKSVFVYVRGRQLPVCLSNLEALSPSTLFAIQRRRPAYTQRRDGRDRAMPVGDRG